MTKKILLGLGSVILLTSTLSARDVSYDRDYDYKDYKKSQKQVKRNYDRRSHERDSYYLSRAEKREIRRMREMKRQRLEERKRRLAIKERKLAKKERRLEARKDELRRQQARNRHYEINKVATIVNLAALPFIIHDIHMKELAMARDRY